MTPERFLKLPPLGNDDRLTRSELNQFELSMAPTSDTLKLHLLVEQTQDGTSIATVLERPDCRSEAPTTEQAITQLQAMVRNRLANI